MPKTFETGHAKNVATFNQLIAFIAGYGPTYNPTKISITLANLRVHATEAQAAIDQVNLALPAYSNAVAAREVAFAPLKQLSTRLLNALKATGVATQVVDNLVTLNRKVQGSRAKAKLSESQVLELSAAGSIIKQNSTFQQSYDNQLANFDKQIKLLAAITVYAPNETDLQVANLQELYADLQTKNNAVVIATIPLSNARLLRNNSLYKTGSGLVDQALNVKNYVKSVFGANSVQYKQISGLSFKTVV